MYPHALPLPSPPLALQVFDSVKATLTQAQALALQTALSTAVFDGEEIKNRLNNRAVQVGAPRGGASRDGRRRRRCRRRPPLPPLLSAQPINGRTVLAAH